MSEASVARVAIVTGGGRGLGRAMVMALAQEGMYVVATAARERAELDEVAATVEHRCGDARVLPVVADVTRDDDCAAVVNAALDRFGGLDVLVNNAARGMKYVSREFFTQLTRFWDVAPDTWRMVVDTNVNGPFLMARHAIRPMLQGNWGRIINIAVSQSTMRRRGYSPYGPSKAALESETIIWARDLEGTGVTVNALLPGGPTLTGMVPESVPAQTRGAMLDPTIIVPPLLWLESPAANGITGRRFVASNWRRINADRSAGETVEEAGW